MRALHWVTAADGSRLACHFHEATQKKATAPAVVLTNGIGTTENFWRHLLAELTKDHTVAHWDYRAHGSSPAGKSGDYGLQTQARDLEKVTEDVMARTGSTAPVHVAFSMGVAVVIELYRTRPDLVSKLVLIGGAPDAPGVLPDAVLRAVRQGLRKVTPAVPALQPVAARVLRSKLLYRAGRALGVLQPRAPRDDIEHMMDAMARMNLQAWVQTLDGLLGAHGSDVLPRVTVPVLIIAAQKDVLMPLKQLQRMRDALPHARFVEVAEAGHAGMLEAGDEMARAIRHFFDLAA